jgi:hypothetical protein
VPFTDQLYGDNVCQKSKEIQDMIRLGRQLNNRGRDAFGRGGIARGRGYYRGGRGNRVGRGKKAQTLNISGGTLDSNQTFDTLSFLICHFIILRHQGQ